MAGTVAGTERFIFQFDFTERLRRSMVAANPARDWRTLPANGRMVAAFDLKPDGLPAFDVRRNR